MYKNTLITGLLLFTCFGAFAQYTNADLIKLAKGYNAFMFRAEPAKEDIAALQKDAPADLKTATDFVVQAISTNNKLLTTPFLSRPDDKVLKQIYLMYEVFSNLDKEDPLDNNQLLDSLKKAQIPVYVMVDNYYDLLFTGVGNKNQPFNLSKTDLTLNEYNLKDETEKGILVLQVMKHCNTQIWGYMNIPKPANTKKALESIKKFPAINGRPYFQYTDFYFPDFEMVIIEDEGMQSYKSHYLNKFYETLIYHLVCLNKEGAKEKEKQDLLLGSVLRTSNLYKYTKYKDTLEEIFQKQ